MSLRSKNFISALFWPTVTSTRYKGRNNRYVVEMLRAETYIRTIIIYYVDICLEVAGKYFGIIISSVRHADPEIFKFFNFTIVDNADICAGSPLSYHHSQSGLKFVVL